MHKTIKNHILKFQVATLCVVVIFIVGATWNIAIAKANGDAKDKSQDEKIILTTLAVETISRDIRTMRDNLIQINSVLKIAEIENQSSLNY